MAVELRPAHAGDAAEVATVLITSRRAHMPYLPEPRTEREIRHWIATTVLRTQEVTVAVDGPTMVGILCVQREQDVSWIRQLFLLPGHVGKGTGSLLLGDALARLPLPVRLWCFQKNTGARRFYERHGFVTVKLTDGRDNEERTPDVLYELVLRVEAADPQGPEALELLREAAIEVRAMYPELHAQGHPSLWPTNPPTAERGAYFLGRMGRAVVASGALRPLDEHTAELRRMYVAAAHRRKGIARAMLARLEDQARKLGYAVLRLETGYKQEAAMALYRACGYREIAPFGEYADDPTSRCFEKVL